MGLPRRTPEEVFGLLASLSPKSDEGAESNAPPAAARALLDGTAAGAAAAERRAAAYFAGLRARVQAALSEGAEEAARGVLQAGIHCLDGFVQHTVTGPGAGQAPVPLWRCDGSELGAPQPAAAPQPEAPLGKDSADDDERWVVSQLEVDGEDAVARIRGLDLLLAALACLAEPLGLQTTAPYGRRVTLAGGGAGAAPAAAPGGVGGGAAAAEGAAVPAELRGIWSWWAARALLLQQQALSGRSATIQAALTPALDAAAAWAAALGGGEAAGVSERDARRLRAALHLEAARAHQAYGVVDAAQRQLELAGDALGVTVSVTGALGRRTLHQLEAKPQLVASLLASGSEPAAGGGQQQQQQQGDDDIDVSALNLDGGAVHVEMEGMQDEAEVFAAPVLEGSPSEAGGCCAVGSAEQALLLAWAAQVKKGSSADDLQQWQMAPYVEAVLTQRRSQYMLQAAARLLKARHERTRGRTRERSLLAVEQLCGAAGGGGPPGAGVRRAWAFGVAFPLWPLLRKELAEHHIAMGFVGPALSIYEELEMWDQLIVCYQLLGKKQAAAEVVQQRLQVTPDDAKLWCALGDVTGDASCYETAWQRSGRRSARAQRSLARAALKRKDWAGAAGHYEAALALSPLYPDCWFSLGYCYLRTDREDKARQAFTKLTQLEPDHGEGWANLAALWLQAGQWRQALSASEQAVRHKRDSWQAWENYALAALRAGALPAAARAAAQVLALSAGQRLPLPVLVGLVEALEAPAEQQQQQQQEQEEGSAAAAAGPGSIDCEEMDLPADLLALIDLAQPLPALIRAEAPSDGAAGAEGAEPGPARRQREQATAGVGAALKAAANAPSCGPEVWGLLGRWYALAGELTSAKEALLKQVRALQGTPFGKDEDAFAAMASASERLAGAYAALAEAGQCGPRDLASARMHLRGVLRQGAGAFEGTAAYRALEVALARVDALEAAAKAAVAAAAAPAPAPAAGT